MKTIVFNGNENRKFTTNNTEISGNYLILGFETEEQKQRDELKKVAILEPIDFQELDGGNFCRLWLPLELVTGIYNEN